MKRFMGKALGMVLSVSMMVSFVPGMTVFAATDDGTGQNVGEIGEVMELPEDVQDVIDMIEALPSRWSCRAAARCATASSPRGGASTLPASACGSAMP